MNFRMIVRIAAISFVAALSACAQAEIAPYQTSVQSSTQATNALHTSGVSNDLLYVASPTHGVSFFTYPKGKYVGLLSGPSVPLGLCSDRSGNVFVVDNGAETILEYAHGGTSPIATLGDYGNDPNGCAVDPKTNDLAVVGGGNDVQGNIAIYKAEQGSPSLYYDRFDEGPYAWCTYDNHSNLFVNDGDGSGSGFGLIELPDGSSSFLEFSLSIRGGGSIQWDGQYLAIASPKGNRTGTKGPLIIYRVQISGSKATIKSRIILSTGKRNRNPGYAVQFWIEGNKISSSKTVQGNLGIWRYPGGGEPIRNIKDADELLTGVTVSIAANR
jgi:hypothetical protein